MKVRKKERKKERRQTKIAKDLENERKNALARVSVEDEWTDRQRGG